MPFELLTVTLNGWTPPAAMVMFRLAPLSSKMAASPFRNIVLLVAGAFQLAVVLTSQTPLPPLPAVPVQVFRLTATWRSISLAESAPLDGVRML